MFVRKTTYFPSWLKEGEVALLIFRKLLKLYFIEDKAIIIIMGEGVKRFMGRRPFILKASASSNRGFLIS